MPRWKSRTFFKHLFFVPGGNGKSSSTMYRRTAGRCTFGNLQINGTRGVPGRGSHPVRRDGHAARNREGGTRRRRDRLRRGGASVQGRVPNDITLSAASGRDDGGRGSIVTADPRRRRSFDKNVTFVKVTFLTSRFESTDARRRPYDSSNTRRSPCRRLSGNRAVGALSFSFFSSLRSAEDALRALDAPVVAPGGLGARHYAHAARSDVPCPRRRQRGAVRARVRGGAAEATEAWRSP